MLRHPSCYDAPAMSSAMKEIPVQLPKSLDGGDEPWHHYLSIDVIWYVLHYTLFHPFVSWVVVLCLRAQYTPYGAPEMLIATAWAAAMTVIGLFALASDRYAFGAPREVDLAEEVIVITGGVEGLGGLLAETYGMRSANIAVLDVKEVGRDESEDKGVVYYKCDVGDAKQVEAAAAKIVEELGAPTILINNAGIVHPSSIIDTTAEDVERTFRVNTLSHFHTIRTFLPYMLKEGRGTIVTVSSVLGHLGAANLSAYTASKAALLALHHSLRAELAQNPDAKHIKTILVTPGQMSTKMFAGLQTPSNFLAPVVTPAEIGKDIIKMIERGESGEIALPLYSRYIQILGVLPVGIQHIVRKMSRLDQAVAKAGLVKTETHGKK